MAVRILSHLALLTILLATTGCGVTRSCLFGRGASCGLCNRVGAIGNALNPLSNNTRPYNPAPVSTAPTCGTPACGTPTCGSTPYAVGMPADCGCQGTVDPYLGGNVDPYLSSGYYPAETVVPGTQTILPGTTGYPIDSYGTGSSWQPRVQSRRVDMHGDMILHEDPLPPGAQLVN